MDVHVVKTGIEEVKSWQVELDRIKRGKRIIIRKVEVENRGE